MRCAVFALASLGLAACAPLTVTPVAPQVTASATSAPVATPTPTPSVAPSTELTRAGFLDSADQRQPRSRSPFAVDTQGAVIEVAADSLRLVRSRAGAPGEPLAEVPGLEQAREIALGEDGRILLNLDGTLLAVSSSGRSALRTENVQSLAVGKAGEVFVYERPSTGGSLVATAGGNLVGGPQVPAGSASAPPLGRTGISKLSSTTGEAAWTVTVPDDMQAEGLKLVALPDGGVVAVSGNAMTAVKFDGTGKRGAAIDLVDAWRQAALARPYRLLCTPRTLPGIDDSVLADSGAGGTTSADESFSISLAAVAPDRQGGFYVAATTMDRSNSALCGFYRSLTETGLIYHVDATGKPRALTPFLRDAPVEGLATAPDGTLYVATKLWGFYRRKP